MLLLLPGTKKTRIRQGGFGFIISTYKGGTFQYYNDKLAWWKVNDFIPCLACISSMRGMPCFFPPDACGA